MKRPMLPSVAHGTAAVIAMTSAMLLLVDASLALAQSWTRTSAPELFWFGVACSAGGRNLVAANNMGSIYTSADSGMSWTARTYSLPGNAAASSADGRVLVVGTGHSIWVSTNSGAAWTLKTTRATAVASSADGRTLVAVQGGSSPGQIYVSTDSGNIWSVTSAPVKNWSAVASSADGTKLVATVGLYAVGPVYTSSNSGATWTPISSATRNWESIASSADGNTLVAADRNSQQIYTSTDSGATWTVSSAPTRTWTSVASSADGSKLVAAQGGPSPGSIYISTDSGTTWSDTSAPLRNWTSVASSADGSKLVAVMNGGGIYTWQSASQSIPALKLTRSGDSAVISWPYYAADYTLQQNTNLATTNWTAVAATPTFANQEWRVEVSPTNDSQFYRLNGF